MSTFSENLESSLQELDHIGSPDWLTSLKEQGRSQFKASGLPGRSIEVWKYSAIPFANQADRKLESDQKQSATDIDPLDPELTRISVQDGDLNRIHGDLVSGVHVNSLKSEIENSSTEIRPFLESLEIAGGRHALSAYNTASLSPGVVIRVDKGIDAGTLLMQWNAFETGSKPVNNSRVLLILEPGSRLHLVEQHENGAGDSAILNLVVQGDLGTGSELTLTRFQELSPASMLIGRTDISQASGSSFHFTALDLGLGMARHDVKTSLKGERANCALNGACVGNGESHMDHHLEASHEAENCQSSQLFRAVASGRSRVVFNGKVFVHKGADGTEAEQSSAGLLLSKLAEIDSKPELEIYADEVIASHGATVGQLDDAALFYMQSRGLNKDQAREILTMAFCRSVTDCIPDENLREILGARLAKALES